MRTIFGSNYRRSKGFLLFYNVQTNIHRHIHSVSFFIGCSKFKTFPVFFKNPPPLPHKIVAAGAGGGEVAAVEEAGEEAADASAAAAVAAGAAVELFLALVEDVVPLGVYWGFVGDGGLYAAKGLVGA